MVATVEPFNSIGRARISQLINKSNQFNLTSRRYTESEVANLEADSGVLTLQARLRDRFGDNGMIGVAVCRRQGGAWDIDTWLMSCRVLGRRVEELFLAEIVRAAREQGVETLRGRFIPTGKNDLVRDHYKKLGFAPVGTDGQTTLWQLDVGSYHCPVLPIEVHRPHQSQPPT
jgi:FkbH-like protein